MPRYSRTNPRRTARERNKIVITLTCGHTIRMRLYPMNPTTTYVCNQGTGCGYVLGWTFWINEEQGHSRTNPTPYYAPNRRQSS